MATFTLQFSRIETYFYNLCKNFKIKNLPDKWTPSSSSLDAFNSEFSRICAVQMMTSFLLTTSGNEIFSWESPLKPITWYQRFRNGLNSVCKCCSTNGTWTKVFRKFKTIKHRIKNTCLLLGEQKKIKQQKSSNQFLPCNFSCETFLSKEFWLNWAFERRNKPCMLWLLNWAYKCFHIYSYKRICILFVTSIKILTFISVF